MKQARGEAPQSGGDSRIAQGVVPSHKLSSTPPPVTDAAIARVTELADTLSLNAGINIADHDCGQLGNDLHAILAARSNQEATPDAARVADLELVADLALNWLGEQEPGDSRAVSNEFVAMAAIRFGQPNLDECREIIRAALATPVQEATRTVGDAELVEAMTEAKAVLAGQMLAPEAMVAASKAWAILHHALTAKPVQEATRTVGDAE